MQSVLRGLAVAPLFQLSNVTSRTIVPALWKRALAVGQETPVHTARSYHLLVSDSRNCIARGHTVANTPPANHVRTVSLDGRNTMGWTVSSPRGDNLRQGETIKLSPFFCFNRQWPRGDYKLSRLSHYEHSPMSCHTWLQHCFDSSID